MSPAEEPTGLIGPEVRPGAAVETPRGAWAYQCRRILGAVVRAAFRLHTLNMPRAHGYVRVTVERHEDVDGVGCVIRARLAEGWQHAWAAAARGYLEPPPWIDSWTVDFGDGCRSVSVSTRTDHVAVHRYSAPGFYVVNARAKALGVHPYSLTNTSAVGEATGFIAVEFPGSAACAFWGAHG